MILDSLDNSLFYEQIHPLFPKAFEYIKSIDLEKIEPGKIELQGLDLFIGISDSTLKDKKEAQLEAHKKYIDIQIPISKKEVFGWSPKKKLEHPIAQFDTEKDIQFFNDAPSGYFELSPSNFVIFFPDDAHAPCIGEGVIRKVVIKIKVQ